MPGRCTHLLGERRRGERERRRGERERRRDLDLDLRRRSGERLQMTWCELKIFGAEVGEIFWRFRCCTMGDGIRQMKYPDENPYPNTRVRVMFGAQKERPNPSLPLIRAGPELVSHNHGQERSGRLHHTSLKAAGCV